MLDVGTNRESLLDDPTYIGNRHARIRGERYDAFIDAYVKAVDQAVPERPAAVGELRARQLDAAYSKSTATASAPSTTTCRGMLPFLQEVKASEAAIITRANFPTDFVFNIYVRFED